MATCAVTRPCAKRKVTWLMRLGAFKKHLHIDFCECQQFWLSSCWLHTKLLRAGWNNQLWVGCGLVARPCYLLAHQLLKPNANATDRLSCSHPIPQSTNSWLLDSHKKRQDAKRHPQTDAHAMRTQGPPTQCNRSNVCAPK